MNAVARAWDVLDAVTDPEIPVVSLRELGILRTIRPAGAGVEVVITPTYSGCPAMEQIAHDVRAALGSAGIAATVTTQLAPAWSTDWISAPAREKLRVYGIAPPGPCDDAAPRGDTVVRLAPARAGDRVAVDCPRCGSHDTTEISHFGSTACKALFRCLACLEPFDHFKPH